MGFHSGFKTKACEIPQRIFVDIIPTPHKQVNQFKGLHHSSAVFFSEDMT